jgi:hypothetical protein
MKKCLLLALLCFSLLAYVSSLGAFPAGFLGSGGAPAVSCTELDIDVTKEDDSIDLLNGRAAGQTFKAPQTGGTVNLTIDWERGADTPSNVLTLAIDDDQDFSADTLCSLGSQSTAGGVGVEYQLTGCNLTGGNTYYFAAWSTDTDFGDRINFWKCIGSSEYADGVYLYADGNDKDMDTQQADEDIDITIEVCD